jgi:hypothetical protein
MGAPVIHFEIMGGEGTQLETFYRELFGWKINSNNPMKYGVVDTGGGPGVSMVALAPPRAGTNVSPHMRLSKIYRPPFFWESRPADDNADACKWEHC